MPGGRKLMRTAAFLVATFTMMVSIAGLVSPERMMTLRRSYYTPLGLYTAGSVRVFMGLVLILAASTSRWPKAVRALGAVMVLQALAANLMGLEHARAIMEWEAAQGTALLRTGAVIALAAGAFIVFAFKRRRSEEQEQVIH
jgi:hypothetical protein